jgi:hypothetical protein
LKTQLLNSTLDWEQYIALMMFRKTSSFKLTFQIEPRKTQNPNSDFGKKA